MSFSRKAVSRYHWRNGTTKAFGEFFQLSTLLLSLFIGFIAGAIAIIGISDTSTPTQPDKQIIITLLGAGYAGTDFIEGFIKKYIPA